ncbi:VOC family protein [Roseomonas sp. E05]|uniref:VOC family protein n=1 Tax=Roseomonas sp. E05 TaxID=3046310 RepID=UPI0024BBD3C8|nr:VOC family protein [Roseomonas sp. E05]MDJ0391056.1 VOC family protein [Roseomonas sp. E05]
MTKILGIDHVAVTAANLEETCAFYGKLFGVETQAQYVSQGRVLVRQISIGGAVLSVHQAGNGVELVARNPTIGAADICFRWNGSIEEAIQLLTTHDVGIIEGPTPRRTADGFASLSVFFRDLDANLTELMAAT